MFAHRLRTVCSHFAPTRCKPICLSLCDRTCEIGRGALDSVPDGSIVRNVTGKEMKWDEDLTKNQHGATTQSHPTLPHRSAVN
jgi:hypothetical protein